MRTFRLLISLILTLSLLVGCKPSNPIIEEEIEPTDDVTAIDNVIPAVKAIVAILAYNAGDTAALNTAAAQQNAVTRSFNNYNKYQLVINGTEHIQFTNSLAPGRTAFHTQSEGMTVLSDDGRLLSLNISGDYLLSSEGLSLSNSYASVSVGNYRYTMSATTDSPLDISIAGVSPYAGELLVCLQVPFVATYGALSATFDQILIRFYPDNVVNAYLNIPIVGETMVYDYIIHP